MKRNHSQRQRYFSPVIVSVVAALYLLFSVGVVKATHLCMGREASVAYFTFESKKCACSLLTREEDDCCDDTHEVLKLEDSQKHLSNFELPVPVLALVGAVYNNDMQSAGVVRAIIRPISSDAQPPPKILFKLHCSFVFYG